MKETSYLDGKSEYLDKLKSIPGLATFRDENLSKMLTLSKLRRYDSKETIIAEGMYDSWIYFLLSGDVDGHCYGAIPGPP
jgi:CRP/FNR family transcriptional regulator, cyclic AMP receptor protein